MTTETAQVMVALGLMTQDAWDTLTWEQKRQARKTTNLHPDLIGLEGWRVAVWYPGDDEPDRFIVGTSTGWAPCHVAIRRANSVGGYDLSPTCEFKEIRKIEKVR